MKKSFVFVLTVGFMFSFFSCSKVKDGIYTGTSAGMQGPVEVKLTVAKGKIAGVEITHEPLGKKIIELYQQAYDDAKKQFLKK